MQSANTSETTALGLAHSGAVQLGWQVPALAGRREITENVARPSLIKHSPKKSLSNRKRPVKKHENTTDRSAQAWRTIAVTTLPGGWCNTYRTENGDVFIEPAPALLLQQLGTETRVTFASYRDGCLEPVCENNTYQDSLPPPDAAARPPKRTGPPPR